MAGPVRILLLADSHLGFDLPTRARVERRRRGHDFLANYARALAPAFAGEVDVVVHAGDVFDRSSVVATLAYQAFEPLRQVAESGVPVLVVPGNHERSRLPHLRFAEHPNLHVFNEPRTVVIDANGARVAFSGFPYERHDVRGRFSEIVTATGWAHHDADARLLCVHHCVEGATVGPVNYTFTTAADVIRHRDVPRDFAAVLTGHIHRHQVLTKDLAGRPLATPVMYPGSIERTAFAEIGERKGYMILTVEGKRVGWTFHELPARPMARHELDVTSLTPDALGRAVEEILATSPPDSVLAVALRGSAEPAHWRVLSQSRLRALAPGMNIEVLAEERAPYARKAAEFQAPEDPQLSLL